MAESSQPDERPELVFALAAPLGTRLSDLSGRLASDLRGFGYSIVPIRLSKLLAGFSDWTVPASRIEDVRVAHCQRVANAVRTRLSDGAVLARVAISEIRRERAKKSGHPDQAARGVAFIVDQLKHPDESRLLRRTYREAFHLVAGHATSAKRVAEFARLIAESADEPGQDKRYGSRALELIETDEKAFGDFGQNMRDTYPQADVFVDLNPTNGETEVGRFVDLIFGHPLHTPSAEEYAMYHASAVALRSSDDSRQVGAAIASINRNQAGDVHSAEVLSVGMNEVPRGGGGLYWAGESPDARDQALRDDRARKIKVGLLAELLGRIREQNWFSDEVGKSDNSELARKLLSHLERTQFTEISEFSRPVHAEMAAIIDAARRGVSIDGSSMYVSTFPCHNCAKHIIAAGLRRVVYLEPYPKSRAEHLYGEELVLDSVDGKEQNNKVVFSVFSGIAPRQYRTLFSNSQRGAKWGLSLEDWDAAHTRLNPAHVPDHLHLAYVAAERQELLRLQDTGYAWDASAICPS